MNIGSGKKTSSKKESPSAPETPEPSPKRSSAPVKSPPKEEVSMTLQSSVYAPYGFVAPPTGPTPGFTNGFHPYVLPPYGFVPGSTHGLTPYPFAFPPQGLGPISTPPFNPWYLYGAFMAPTQLFHEPHVEHTSTLPVVPPSVNAAIIQTDDVVPNPQTKTAPPIATLVSKIPKPKVATSINTRSMGPPPRVHVTTPSMKCPSTPIPMTPEFDPYQFLLSYVVRDFGYASINASKELVELIANAHGDLKQTSDAILEYGCSILLQCSIAIINLGGPRYVHDPSSNVDWSKRFLFLVKQLRAQLMFWLTKNNEPQPNKNPDIKVLYGIEFNGFKPEHALSIVQRVITAVGNVVATIRENAEKQIKVKQ